MFRRFRVNRTITSCSKKALKKARLDQVLIKTWPSTTSSKNTTPFNLPNSWTRRASPIIHLTNMAHSCNSSILVDRAATLAWIRLQVAVIFRSTQILTKSSVWSTSKRYGTRVWGRRAGTMRTPNNTAVLETSCLMSRPPWSSAWKSSNSENIREERKLTNLIKHCKKWKYAFET